MKTSLTSQLTTTILNLFSNSTQQMTLTGNPTMRNPTQLLPTRLLFAVLLLIGLLGGCDSEQLPPLHRNDIILAFGDSLTRGVGATDGATYPQALADLTGMTVINSGISGETTTQGVSRFPKMLQQHQPQLVILLEGGNDILRNHKRAITKQNLAKMIEMAQAQNIQVVLIGVPEKKLFSNSAKLYRELAEEYGLVFEEELLSDLLKTAQYKSDPIHLNSAGYLKLAEGVHQLLLDNGGLK